MSTTEETVSFVIAAPNQSGELLAFLLKHGPNQWNYLPEDGTREEFLCVARGEAFAVTALEGERVVGFAVCFPGFVRFPEYVDPSVAASHIGYIADVVVHNERTGRGIGQQLLVAGVAELANFGVRAVYIDCHEENLPSRGMISKAGFAEVAIYFDPVRRGAGSRNSVVSRKIIEK